MKLKICILSILFAGNLAAQELPTNPQTGLIFIKDSIEINGKSLQEVKDILSKWGNTLLDMENLKSVYQLNNSKQTEMVAVNLPVNMPVLTQDKGGNRFLVNGTLTYSKTKTKGLVPTATFGGIKFSFSYTITAKKLFYEFTNLEYSHDMVHYGKFEGDKPPSDNYNKSFLFKMSKKEWAAVKTEYYNNLKILSANLKRYAENLFASESVSANMSQINYDSYKKIVTGMSYDDVAKLLADEGKELNNTSTQVNGKTVTQQTIIWNDLDKTKSITVTFTDGKVVSKTQTNL